MRANEKPLTLRIWLKVMDFLGYKLVGKDKLCTSAEEMYMLRLGYAFVTEDPATAARFAAWQEARTRTLDWSGTE